MQHRADLDEQRIVRPHACAMPIRIDLDQRGNGRGCAALAAATARACSTLSRITATSTPRLRSSIDALQLAGRNAYGIQNVAHARIRERLGFTKRGHRGRAGRRIHHQPRDIHRLCSLEMWPKCRVQLLQTAAQALDVAFHALPVQQQAGRAQPCRTRHLGVDTDRGSPIMRSRCGRVAGTTSGCF